MYVIASRLCEHSNIVRFKKRAAKTLQHGHTYGDILMLYGTINTHEWFPFYNWHELCFRNKLLEFSSIYCLLVKYAIWISNINELLPHSYSCRYATSCTGGPRSGNHLILGNAWKYSDMKFFNISRKGLGRPDLFPYSCGDVLYDVPPTHVDKFILLHAGYLFLSYLICQLKIAFFEFCWLYTTSYTKYAHEI